MNHHNCINSPQAIAAALRARFVELGMKQKAISEACGLNQGQVSRILNGRFKECKGHVARLCKYAEITIVPHTVDPSQNLTLMQALRKVWDGSDKHAQAIAKVVLALSDIKSHRHP